MKVFIGSDHAGYHLKTTLKDYLLGKGQDLEDLGVDNAEVKADYPDQAKLVSDKVISTPGSMGILVCGSGTGMCIAANKVKGIRAACANDVRTAQFARLHNNANIVGLGERFVEENVAKEVVGMFLGTAFEGGRHEARVEKISQMEK